MGDRMTLLRAFVINLDRRPDRMDALAPRLDALGIAWERLPATDGGVVAEATLQRRFVARGPLGRLGRGDMACTLSHLAALERFLAGDAPAAVILEDDVEIADDLPELMATLDWLPENTDLVKLDRYMTRGLVILLGRPTGAFGGRALRPLLSRHAGGAGYLVTRRGAARILAMCRASIPVPIDHLLFNANVSPVARALAPLQMYPAMVQQRREELGSDIGRMRKSSVPKGLGYWIREGRRGLYEISRVPLQLAALARGARVVEPAFDPGKDPS